MADSSPDLSPQEALKQIQAFKSPATSGDSSLGDIWKSIKEYKEPSIGASLWGGIKRGLMGPLESGAESGAAMLRTAPESAFIPEAAPSGAIAPDDPQRRAATAASAERGMEKAETAYQQSPERTAHPLVSGLGRAAGNIAASAPLMAVPGASGAGMGLGARTLMGAGLGAAAGGPAGAVGGGLAGGLGGMIGPAIDPAFQAIATKIPQLADMAIGKLGRTPEAFQQAFANWVMAPIKQVVPRGVKVGEDLINHVGDELSAVYNKILPKVTFRANEPNPDTGLTFQQGLEDLKTRVPQEHDKDFARVLDREITKRLDEGGTMSGEDYKKAISNIGQLASRFTGWKANSNQELYGDALKELQAHMREALAIHNVPEADALRQVDQAWSRYVRMADAAGARRDANSEFLPNDILNVAKKEYGARAFAGGRQPLTAFGRAGNDLIAQKPPKFGVYLQELAGAAGAGLGGTAGHAMGGPVGGYAGATAGRSIGKAATGGMATRRVVGPGLRATGDAINRMAPAAGRGTSELDRIRKRMDAARKVGEIQKDRHLANRQGDYQEMERLGKKLAEAQRDYRDLGGTA